MDEINGYERLDELRVISERSGKEVLRFGLGAQLLFNSGWMEKRRNGALGATSDFADLFAPLLTHWQKPAATRLSPLTGTDWHDNFAAQIKAQKAAQSGAFLHLCGPEDIPLFDVSVNCPDQRRQAQKPLTRWAATCAGSWLKAHDTATYIEHVKTWCSHIQPEQGTCGLTPIAEHGMMRNRFKEYWPFLARCVGLDFADGFPMAAGSRDGIRTVNWLTILDDGYVADLGGIGRIEGFLHSESTIHLYEGGIIIQACEHPQMGDINMGNIPEPYVKVNRAIRPARFEEYPSSPMALIKVAPPMDALEETLAWIRRFDPEL